MTEKNYLQAPVLMKRNIGNFNTSIFHNVDTTDNNNNGTMGQEKI